MTSTLISKQLSLELKPTTSTLQTDAHVRKLPQPVELHNHTLDTAGARAEARHVEGGLGIGVEATGYATCTVVDIVHRRIVAAPRVGAAGEERRAHPIVGGRGRVVVEACAVRAAGEQARAVIDVGVRV